MVMRIGGLASGMDIDTLVSDLMKAERIPLDKIKQKKQITEWQRDGFREMNSLLLSFRNKTFDMKLSDTYRARTTTSSNESKVVATAKSSAALSSFNISRIQKLATAATKNNAGAISDPGTKIDPTKSLYEIQDNFLNNNFGWETGSVESETIVVSDTNEPIRLKNLKRDDGVTLQNIPTDTSVIVNGKSYEVVDIEDGLTDDQVYVTADGELKFKNALAKGSTIKVDYAATSKVETFSASEEKESIQLSKKPVSSLELTVGDTTYTYDEFTNSFTDGSNTINDITLDANTGKVTFANGIADNKEIKANYEQSYFSFDLSAHTSKGQVNQRFLIQGSESLNSTLNKITSSNVGVSAFYDEYTDRVTLTRKETGNFNESGVEIETSAGFLNNILRFGSGVETGGDNAEFTINGLETQRTSNTFEMNGVSFTLKDTLNKVEEGETAPTVVEPSISINISNNTDKVFENIKSFIDEYNTLIDKIHSKVNEERYRDYLPLTDDEREQLTDKQQEDWEERAKSGLLRRDPLLTNILSQMRSDFYTPVSGNNIDPNYNQLTSIGIKTTSNYMDGGKLEITESELRQAIEDNPAAIEALFTSSGTTNGEKGILNRLYDNLTITMDNIKEKAGNSNTTNSQFTLGRNLDNITDQIQRFEDRLTQVEDRYWRQFTAMEKAIQQSNSQMSYLMQQFSS